MFHVEVPKRKLFTGLQRMQNYLLLSRVYLYMQDWKNAKVRQKRVSGPEIGRYWIIVVLGKNTESYAISEKQSELLFLSRTSEFAVRFYGSGG